MDDLKAWLSTAMRPLRRVARWLGRSGPQDLARESERRRSEQYWRDRAAARGRRFRVVALRYRVAFHSARAREGVEIARGALVPAGRGLVVGGILFVGVLVIEAGMARYAFPGLVPEDGSSPPLGAFPALAAQVTASLLGFYLASVSIVIGTSYPEVSADVRRLVLEGTETRLYLGSIGMAIGAGLALVLLQSVGVPFGYASVGAYGA